MMLGKRGRPVIKRTTSITEFTVEDLTYLEAPQPHQINHPNNHNKLVSSPRKLLVENTSKSHFLRSCGLCNRQLASGRDIYMYRGDGAFCSLECRQQQMNQDEMKDKFPLLSSTRSYAAGTSTNGGTVAAA